MWRTRMVFASACMSLSMASFVGAQTPSSGASAAEQRALAIERCKANRGVDCSSAAGLEEWIRQERPITEQEQAAAAGARRHRELCRQKKGGPGC